MAGFCAGRVSKVNLGDVFVPEKIYTYDTGKQLSETELLPEINAFRLDPLWIQKIERFGNEWRDSIEIERPVTYDSQIKRFVEILKENNYSADIISLMDCPELPNSDSIIEEGCKQKYLTIRNGVVSVTDSGRDHYLNTYALKYYKYQDPELEVKMGALATGTNVQQWDGIFQKLENQYERKTYALDMEGYALANVAWIEHIPFIVAKGVGDFASGSKAFDNRYINYATVASFKFIMAFFNSLEGLELLSK